MKHDRIITLTHANTELPVQLRVEAMAFWTWNETAKAVLVFCLGQNCLPVKENFKEIQKKLDELVDEPKGE